MADRSRKWIFTLNNPSPEEIAHIECLPDSDAVDIIAACHEVGAEGTPHIQGMVEWVNAKSLSATKKALGSKRFHLQERRGSLRRAWAYAMKGCQSKTEWEAKGEAGANWGRDRSVCAEKGCPPEEQAQDGGTWANIVEMVKAGRTYLEIVDAYPKVAVQQGTAIKQYQCEWHNSRMGWRDVTTISVDGSTGVGKTRSIMEAYGYSNCYRVTDYKHGMFDAYNGEDVLIFEEFRNSLKVEQMLNFLDGYPVRLPCRFADKMARFTKVFIVSNWAWGQQYDGIQMNHPETYAALLRRIDDYVTLETSYQAEQFKTRLLAEQNAEEEE